MKLKELKKEINFKWRLQSCNMYGAQCVAYIDARDVQDLLDNVVGEENWQVKYSEYKGNLFASIGIKCGEEWVFKSDCGTESNVEKQKGEASDAFKRAGVMWGIGRFLYSKDILKIRDVVNVNNKYYPATPQGKRIYNINEYCNGLFKNSQTVPVKKVTAKVYTDCKTKEELRAFYASISADEQSALKDLITEFALKLK